MIRLNQIGGDCRSSGIIPDKIEHTWTFCSFRAAFNFTRNMRKRKFATEKISLNRERSLDCHILFQVLELHD